MFDEGVPGYTDFETGFGHTALQYRGFETFAGECLRHVEAQFVTSGELMVVENRGFELAAAAEQGSIFRRTLTFVLINAGQALLNPSPGRGG